MFQTHFHIHIVMGMRYRNINQFHIRVFCQFFIRAIRLRNVKFFCKCLCTLQISGRNGITLGILHMIDGVCHFFRNIPRAQNTDLHLKTSSLFLSKYMSLVYHIVILPSMPLPASMFYCMLFSIPLTYLPRTFPEKAYTDKE